MVDVDNLRGDVGVGRVGVVGGQPAQVGRILVFEQRRFFQPHRVGLGLEDLQAALARHRHQALELVVLGVEAHLAELLERPGGDLHRGFRTGVVRLFAHDADGFFDPLGLRYGENLRLESPLRLRALLVETAQRFVLGL